MIFPEIEPNEWIKKYPGLKIKTVPCRHCEGDVYIDKPFLSRDYAGFVSFKCSVCQGEHNATCALPISKNEISDWKDLLK